MDRGRLSLTSVKKLDENRTAITVSNDNCELRLKDVMWPLKVMLKLRIKVDK